MFNQGESLILGAAFSNTLKPVAQTVEVEVNQMDLAYKGELADPAVVEVVIKDPDGIVTTSTYGIPAQPYPIVKQEAGVYYAKLLLNHPGRWRYQWRGDPDTQDAKVGDEVEIDVSPSRIA